jgi:magnesium transporter
MTTRVHVFADGTDRSVEHRFDELPAVLERPGAIVWVDVDTPDEGEIADLARLLELHELAVEDTLGEHQRPKLDHYGNHLFLVLHAVRLDAATTTLERAEIDTFVGDRWMVTVHRGNGFDVGAAIARADRSPGMARDGVSYLLYGLLDLVVDGYFETIDAFDDFFDGLTDQIFSGEPLDTAGQRDWFRMRQALVRFHRVAVPMREAVSALMRHENRLVADALYPYYQDVYDHILRVSESTEALRDLVASIVETNLSLRDYRQNQVMKKVTSWAAIIAVPTLVTGFYGMNVPYPGSGSTGGAVSAVALVVILSAALYAAFRRNDWL